MYGNAIQDLFTRGLDWQTGSTLALFLLAVVAVLMAVFGRFLRVRAVAGERRRDLAGHAARAARCSSGCSWCSCTCRS